MNHRIRMPAVAAFAAAGLALAGCSSSGSHDDKPTHAPSATTTPASAGKPADKIAACTDAIAAGKDTGDGAPECADLSADDYMKALRAANERGRGALESAIASASAAAR